MKNKIITVSFLAIIFGVFLANLVVPDTELSFGERRKLAQLPEFSVERIFNAKYMDDFDKYTTDQFIGREFFRRVKTFVDKNAFLKLDTNGLFHAQNSIFSIEYPLREDKVAYMCQRLNALYDRYLSDMNVYYSIVPDKNYYLPDNGSYLIMDYRKLETLMARDMPKQAKYIDLFDTLTLDNYYCSDGHWRQETLAPVVSALYEAMGNSQVFDPTQYDYSRYTPFYGVYYGQLAGMADPDTLIWLENQVTRDAQVTTLGRPGQKDSPVSYSLYKSNDDYSYDEYLDDVQPLIDWDESVPFLLEDASRVALHGDLPVYYQDGLGGMDSYDVYLYGAQPLIFLDNPHNSSGRELIIFRDSYGSSLAPLLLEGYSRITLVDLRYITQELLSAFISFDNQDVLCMFSTTIINNSDIVR